MSNILVQINMPEPLRAAVDRAAKRTFSSRAEYIRRALILALNADGYLLHDSDLASAAIVRIVDKAEGRS